MGDAAEELPFVLVTFPSEDEGSSEHFVAARSWLRMNPDSQDVECFWPKQELSDRQLAALVMKLEEPDDSFEPHPCEVGKSYDNYLSAHLGAKNRTKDNTYETEREFGVGRRKKRKNPLVYSSDEENEDPIIKKASGARCSLSKGVTPVTVKFNYSKANNLPSFVTSTEKNAKTLKITRKDKGTTAAERNAKILKIIRKDKGTNANSLTDFKKILDDKKKKLKENNKQKKQLSLLCTSPNGKASSNISESNSKSPAQVVLGEEDSNDEHFMSSPSQDRNEDEMLDYSYDYSFETLPESAKSVQSPHRRISKKLDFSSSYPDGFERKVLTLLREINEKIENVSTNQSKLNMHVIPNEKIVSRPAGIPTLPLKTSADVELMEQYLNKDQDNISNLAIYLSTYVNKGASKEYSSALNILSHVMWNSLAKTYNFSGTSGKSEFRSLLLWKAIQGAVTWKFEDSDLTETKRAAQSWLSNAPWRQQEDGTAVKLRLSSSTKKK